MKTLEWTLGKSECAISGIMVWIYVRGWFILGEIICIYIGIKEILLCVVYTYNFIQCHPHNMRQS